MNHPLTGIRVMIGASILVCGLSVDTLAQDPAPVPAPTPLRVTPTVLSTSSIVGDFPEAELGLELRVDDPGKVAWRVQEVTPWLTVSPLRGVLTDGAPDSVWVSLGPSAAPTTVGERRGLIVLGAIDRPDVTVNVLWSVVEPPPAEEADSKPWYARPLVWITAGAVVAAGVVIAATS